MYNSQEIAERIKLMAKQHNISINQMLLGCSLGKNTISKMSDGADIMTQNLAKIADYLDCSVDYLLGRDKFTAIQQDNDYDKLDIEDKAEIRGMIRQMLKSDKYKKTDGYTQSVRDFDNALDITPLFEQLKNTKNQD